MNIFNELNQVIDRASPRQAYSEIMTILAECFSARQLVDMLEHGMSDSEQGQVAGYFDSIYDGLTQGECDREEGAWLDSRRRPL